ncbi:MAG: septum site-determining protein MinD [Bdellovibrionales bacterium]|nr:septum site-determining protein MinD [Bdellovibrionales bacterium]
MGIRNGSVAGGSANGEVIVVTSGKGGVGKTTTTASLGAALALRGKKTLVIDADIGLRNLDVILGLENRIVFNLVDVAKGLCKPSQAIIRSKKTPNLYLLPASQTDEKDVVSEEQVKKAVDQYRREFNFILVDSPAGIEQGFKNACAAADRAIVVTTPEVSAIRDADRVVGLLAAREIEANLLVNRVDYTLVQRGDMLSIPDVQDILGIDLIGVVERDEAIIIAANCGEPVVFNKRSKAGDAFSRIARRICGEEVEIPQLGSGSIWGRIGRRLGVAS